MIGGLLTIEFHKLISRHGFTVKRELIEGMASRLSIAVNDIPAHLDAMVGLGLWGCEQRDTVKRGWLATPVAPEGTVCP